MLKRFGAALFTTARRVEMMTMKNRSSTSSITHSLSSVINNSTMNDLKFSTICNKQEILSVVDDLYNKQFTREYVDRLLVGVKKIISSADFQKATSIDLGELDVKISRHLKEFPDKPLPKEILYTITGAIDNYSIFQHISALLYQDKYHSIIENVDEMKRKEVELFMKLCYFSSTMIKGIQQDWFNFEELKLAFPVSMMMIDIEGKDITLHDQVTYISGLYEVILESFVNVGRQLATRETLMCLISLILLHFQRSDRIELVIELMKRFVEFYPIVKTLYTTPSCGDINKSWTDILGKVYSSDEFDWCHDLETDLPIHLGGMCNIFKEFIGNAPTESKMKVLEEESKRASENPYIPYLQIRASHDLSYTDECLKILMHSKAYSRCQDLKRIELFGIFKNKKPTSVARINDFKFFPQLLVKIRHQASKPEPDIIDLDILMDQVEYYSRVPTHVDLIIVKFKVHLEHGRLEEALQNYQCLEYYEKYIPKELLAHLTELVTGPMIALGYYKEIIELIEKFKEKYGAVDPSWGKLRQLAVDRINKITKR